VVVEVQGSGDLIFSQALACPDCGINLPELEPRLFSFNNPFGACPACHGLGVNMELEPDLIVPDQTQVRERRSRCTLERHTPDGYYMQLLDAVCKHFGIPTEAPFDSLTEEQVNIILYGSGTERIHFHYENQYGRTSDRRVTFEGVIPNLERRYKSASERCRPPVDRGIHGYQAVPGVSGDASQSRGACSNGRRQEHQ
jgi:excinuclease ABC subunit A